MKLKEKRSIVVILAKDPVMVATEGFNERGPCNLYLCGFQGSKRVWSDDHTLAYIYEGIEDARKALAGFDRVVEYIKVIEAKP